jgi:hypothetical protein
LTHALILARSRMTNSFPVRSFVGILTITVSGALAACGSDSASSDASTGGRESASGGAGAKDASSSAGFDGIAGALTAAGTGGTGNGGAGRGGATNTAGNPNMPGVPSAGSTAGGASGACAASCQRLASAACGVSGGSAVDTTACVTECNTLLSTCPAEAPAYVACVANPSNAVSCVDSLPAIAGCDATSRAIGACLVCQPRTNDNVCAQCSRSTCCDQLQAYVGSADAADFEPCIDSCADQACADACAAQFPTASAKFAALNACQRDSCTGPCVCQTTADDTPCLACGKQNCCVQFAEYLSSADVDAFTTCAEPCADEACVEACAAQSPIAGAARLAYVECASGACATDCMP